MRVTLLSKALVAGAYQRKCELIAAHPDIELTVLVPPVWDKTSLERAHTRGYDLRVIPIRFNGNFHLHHYPTLAQELADAKPDVFHIDEEPYNLATWLALRDATHLTRFQDRVRFESAWHPPHTLFFSWQNINRAYPPPFDWIERDVLRRADAAIVGSCEGQNVWREKGFSRDIRVIPQFGVDEEAFFPRAKNGGRHGSFIVGFAGRLHRQKGVDLLLRAFAGLPADAKLMLIGSGDQEENLRELARQLNIADRVQFRANVASTHMPLFYRKLDAFVLPSRTIPSWKEQFGRVLIEAMACGVSVIGSRCGEIPNVIGDAGLLFDEEDVDGLRAHLLALMEQPRLREDWAHRGRARALANYTMKRIADQTVEVYRQLGLQAQV